MKDKDKDKQNPIQDQNSQPATPLDQPIGVYETETKLVHLGNDPRRQFGFVSPPIYRGSTAIYDDVKSMKQKIQDPLKSTFPNYGRFGSPNARAFETALCELEGGHGAVCTGSGLSAITTAILSLVESGDHLLIVDSAYWPTRNFCDALQRFGIEAQYYDPRIGANISSLFKKNTKLVYMESPGSVTFEIQDVPAITKVCQQQKIKTIIDNTWATPLYFRPLTLGVDISLHSCTKYITGHADSFLGVIICNEVTYPLVRSQSLKLGQCAGADDVFLGLRGLRTLGVRLQHHEQQAYKLAEWLKKRPEVTEVLYPALPSSPDFTLWKRDFTGATGLLGIVLPPEYSLSSVEAMVDALKIFSLGHSWGGFESLVVTGDPASYRLKESWQTLGHVVRFHVGFENIEDLKKDITQAFQFLRKETE